MKYFHSFFPELLEAIRNLPLKILPCTEDIHLYSAYLHGCPDTSHFYLKTDLMLLPNGTKKMSQEDWKRLCEYVEEKNYSNLSYYDPCYEDKKVYEEYLE